MHLKDWRLTFDLQGFRTGKDKYVFLTEEDATAPSTLSIPDDVDRPEKFLQGMVDDKGTLNWECACKGSLVSSKCGVEMRNFFQCIHDNMDNDDKFETCGQHFVDVKICMDKNAEYYGNLDSEKENDDDSKLDAENLVEEEMKDNEES